MSEREAAPTTLHGARLASGERPAVRSARGAPSAVDPGGFSGSCAHASLDDWIQLIQMGGRDAIIVVRAPGEREGRLWCKAGDIVDARWGGFIGEEAVYQLLSLESGDVTVDFGSFERPRTVRTSTAGLLLEAAYRKDTRVSETHALGHDAPRSAGAPGSTAPTAAGPPSGPPPRDPGQKRRLLLWAAAATATLAVAIWLPRRAGPVSTTATAGLAPNAPAEDFSVNVEAEPAEAEIRLDGQVVSTRALTTRLPRDGQLHEIVVSAHGYVPEFVTFRDRPPRDRIALERLAATAEPAPARADETTLRGPRRAAVVLRRPAPTAEPGNVAATTPATSPATPAAARARIQVIEERQPRIQVIGDDRPSIQSIE